MRDLTNNGQPIGVPVSEYETQACSLVKEPGVYFGPNKGYVIFDRTFGVNFDFEVRMSLKPRVKTGVIFSVAMPREDYASLELIDGVFLFRVQTGPGEIVANRYAPPEGSAYLCDGQWHDIVVVKNRGSLHITVDGDEGELVTGSSPRPAAANTDNPLYFGGIPDGEEANHPGIIRNEHYVGCMRDIVINSDPADLATKEYGGDVRRHSCYVN